MIIITLIVVITTTIEITGLIVIYCLFCTRSYQAKNFL